ncbi:MAG: GNAT family N-acetyltransferase [Candidatus Izemoplasmataceae bacterium]
MQVKIFTEAGKDIGLGHFMRCRALYDELNNRDIKVELYVYGEIDYFSDKKLNLIKTNWINEDFLETNILESDYVVVDSYIAEKKHYNVISRKSNKALYIDDTKRVQYPKGLILNPSLNAKSRDYSYTKSDSLLLGSKYIILRPAFREPETKVIKGEVNRVLIIMGGTDGQNLTKDIINDICRQYKNIDFDIVLSPNQYQDYMNIFDLQNVYFYKNVDDKEMHTKIYESDFVISGAGQTIYELMVTKTPFIAIKVADNQTDNIKSIMQNISSDIVIDSKQTGFLKSLQKIFVNMLDYNFRRQLSSLMDDVIDSKGVNRIVDIFLGEYSINNIHLRNAKPDDIKDIFELSNQDYVRHHSINSHKITWDEHCRWFEKILDDEAVVFYIVTDINHSFLGQIRYNITNQSAVVSISFSVMLKGKRLSKSILKKSMTKLFVDKPKLNSITAYVSEDNIASIRLFTNSGYKQINLTENIIEFKIDRSEYHENE